MKVTTAFFFIRTSIAAALLIICSIALESCSSTAATKITGTWRDPEAKKYKDFFVAVLSKNLPARSALEGDISRRLKREGVKATESLDVFSHSEKIETEEEKKAAVEKIQGLGHEAIMVVVLVRRTEEDRYVQGANSYTPTPIGVGSGYYNPARGAVPAGGSYGAFGGYYMSASSAYTTPGYYETDKIYFIESRVYEAATSKLVWSAKSESFNPGEIETASSDFSLVMVDAMKKASLLYKEEKKK